MNKHNFFKTSIRSVKSSYKRFLSLMFLSLLGVGFFAGIKTTTPDMNKTIDKYFDITNTYDLSMTSNLGFTNDDIKELNKLNNIDKVYGVYTKDILLSDDVIVKLISNSNVNKPHLEKGNNPKKKDEILVEQSFLDNEKHKIGDTITIDNKKLKIVGTANSSLYLIKDRGSTNIGNGKINYFIYTDSSVINNDYYSNIYITCKNCKDMLTNSNEYLDKVDKTKKEIEDIKSKLEDNRFNKVYKDLLNMINTYHLNKDDYEFISPNITISDRTSNEGYINYVNAYEALDNIGNFFPLIFYGVAILISLISMMRMVDEDRGEIGTLKALGYSNNIIVFRYIMYSLSATVIGALIGVSIGMYIIPTLIMDIYNQMFHIPYIVIEFNILYTLIGTIVAVICICGSTLYVAVKNLLSNPAILMTEKAPKIGKKILIERIPFIWNKFNFSNKVTIRNIFRYKSKMLVTLIGVSGSTALVLLGFGLSDTIKNLANTQYNDIFLYNRTAYISKTNIDKTLDKYKDIKDYKYVVMKQVDIRIDNSNKDVILISPSTNLDNQINLIDIDNKNKLKLVNNKVIISEKLHKAYKLNINDTIKLNNKTLKISAITKNYIADYIYMNKYTYKKVYGNYNENAVLIKDNGNEKLNKKLVAEEDIISVTTSNDTYEVINTMVGSLDQIMIVLIVSAALLALVIMYNLANINISERRREIATLKVLGFYDKEVDDYIIKETTLLTILGIILGLIFGYYLSYYLISTCEPSMLLFKPVVTLTSYIISSTIIAVFMLIVNLIIHGHLYKIDMIESLKNRE